MRKDLFDFGATILLSPVGGFMPEIGGSLRTASTSTGIVVLYSDTAQWVLEATRRLEALGKLRVGWDTHGGRPLRMESRNLTVRTLDELRTDSLPTPNVVLGSGGNVHLEWQAKGKELEVELEGDAVDYVKVTRQGQIEEGRTPEADDPVKAVSGLTQWLMQD